jgi:hypothetical protein
MQALAVVASPTLIRLRAAVAGVTAGVALYLGATGQVWAAGVAAVAALAALRMRQPACRLQLRADGRCEIDGGPEAVVAGAFCGAGWVVLRLAQGARRGRRCLVLAPDAATAEELRQLRVWIKWAALRRD